MAILADAVIVEFEARLAKYNADLRSSTSLFQKSIDTQSRSVKKLEADVRRSSSQISGTLKGLAGAFAGVFSVQQIGGLLDSFTRFQNSLKVTGLQGDRLAGVQEKLFAIAQQYGTELESVGQLYSRAAQNAKELGASETDLLSLTKAVSASLKVSGTSASQASGALLQLGQALGSPRIQAEEFNSLLDVMQPLLREASKNIEGTGGTLSGLTRLIKDAQGPGVSNVQLFRAITAALAELESQAARSTTTLGQAFTKLGNALTNYLGQADQSNGVTAALASAIGTLAKNLDSIIPAIVIIAAAIGTRYVIGLLRATAASVGLRLVSVALAAQLGGTAAAATLAGRALVGAFGGPVLAAIAAVAVGLGVVITKMDTARQASGQYAAQQTALAKIQAKTTAATEAVATATGKARAEAIANAKALRQETEQYLAVARAALIAAKAKAVAAQRESKVALSQAVAKTGRGFEGQLGANQAVFDGQKQAEANVRAANANVAGAEKEIARLTGIINSARAPKVEAITPDKKTKERAGGNGPGGPSAQELALRAASEQAQLDRELLQAKIALTASFGERADLELEAVALEREQRNRDLTANKDLTSEQRRAQQEVIDELFGVASEIAKDGTIIAEGRPSLIAQQINRDRITGIEQERLDVAEAAYRAEESALQDKFDLARSDTARRDIALQLIDLEEKYRVRLLDSIIAQTEIYDAKQRQIAQIEKTAILEGSAARKNLAKQANETPAQRFRREINKDADELNEDFEQVAIDGLQNLNDQLVDAILNSKNLAATFSNVAKSIVADLLRIAIQQTIIKPLGEALFGAGSTGIGGSSGGILSSFFALFRAGGGPVTKGNPYIVGEAGRELFVPSVSGTIIPNGQLRSSGMGGGTSTIRIELSGDVNARMVSIAQGVSVDVVKVAAPQIVESSVAETYRRGSRPRM